MRRAAAALAITLLAGGCGSSPGTVGASATQPDFSGWWIWDYAATNDFPAGGLSAPPFKPEVLARMQDASSELPAMFQRAMASDASYEEGARLTAFLAREYCLPPHFTGVQAGEGAVEFLATPGRITILDESGLVRRIALDQPLPADPMESSAGTSVGHWEDGRLVVETTGFDSETLFAGEKIGRGVRSVERIWLAAPDVLQIDVTLTVPELFAMPYEHTYVFRRDPDHELADATHCKANDRSVDQATGKDRFDLTPPHDLPPPPSD